MAGWSYEDWAGVVYPPGAPASLDKLAYVAAFVDCIEVNSSFYRPPTPRTTASWVRRTESFADFTFTVKLWQRFTHDRGTTDFARDVQQFREAIQPLSEAGKCGALLIQFPWSFKRTPENAGWIARLCEAFDGLRPVVEVRHASWNEVSVLEWFRRHGVGLCAIDQPQLPGSLPAMAFSTGGVGYARFHGRNEANWFRKGAATWERYNYLYTEEELDPWIARIREIAAGSKETFAITNNHYRGQALVNALEIRATLLEADVPAPEPLRKAYPRLARRTVSMDPTGAEGSSGDLFD